MVSVGQGAGRGGWVREGPRPRSRETLATRVTEGGEGPALAGEGRGGDTVTGAPPPPRPWAEGIKAARQTLPARVQDRDGGGREIKRRGCQDPPLQTLPWGPGASAEAAWKTSRDPVPDLLTQEAA